MNVYQQEKRETLTLHATHHRYTSITLEMYFPIFKENKQKKSSKIFICWQCKKGQVCKMFNDIICI